MLVGANLSLRIMSILIAGFVLLQLLTLAAVSLPGQADESRPYNLPLPAQLRTMTEALERTPRGTRDAFLAAFNDSLYHVEITPAAKLNSSSDQDLLELRGRYAEAMPDRAISVLGEQPLLRRLLGSRPRPGRLVAPVAVAVRLDTGELLVVDSRPSALIRGYLHRRSIFGALAGLLLLAALLLAVRQTTQPLVRLSRGVRDFAAGLDGPDLPETGPREVRNVARALNEMKSKIANLVEERTRVLAAIAHDMRTYLTRLRLRVEFIDDEQQRANATRDLAEISALLNDTLLLAMAEKGAQPPPAALDLAGELIALAAERRELGEEIDLVCPIRGIEISARRTGFRRILSNLIDNGLRHGDRVSISVAAALDRAVVTITDNGPGVAEEALARLGEPFHRLDPSRDRDTGGAGLGLSIVRALAARDDAQVRFANSEDGGLQASIAFRIVPPRPSGQAD